MDDATYTQELGREEKDREREAGRKDNLKLSPPL